MLASFWYSCIKIIKKQVFAITSLGGQNFENTQISVFSKNFQSTVFFEIHYFANTLWYFFEKTKFGCLRNFSPYTSSFRKHMIGKFFENPQLRVCDKITNSVFSFENTICGFFRKCLYYGLAKFFFRSAFFRDYY